MVHFKSGGSVYSVSALGKPFFASQDFARKIQRLTEDGSLDWLVGEQEEAPTKEGSPRPSVPGAHLIATLRLQLTIPGPDSRVRDRRISKDEFLHRWRDTPGGHWYWGWEADHPVLSAEVDMDYAVLRAQTAEWPFWQHLDDLRMRVGEYVNLRDDAVDAIESDALSLTKLSVLDSGAAEKGSMTSSFAITVYTEAVHHHTAGPREHSDRYQIDESLEAELPPTREFRMRSPNNALIFNRIVIGWVGTGGSSSSPGCLDLISSRGNRLARAHAELIRQWSEDKRMAAMVDQYRELSKLAGDLQT